MNSNSENNLIVKNSNTYSKREDYIKEYQDLIPDIRNFADRKEKGQIDLSFLGKEIRDNMTSLRVRNLFFSIVDIRNNNSPTSTESNSIVKTDNKFSNETKKLVRTLLSKGLSNMEIGYEITNIYGSSAICSKMYHEKVPLIDKLKHNFCMLFEFSFIGISFGLIGRRIVKLLKRRA